MRSLNIQKPALINETQAMQCIFEAFKQAMGKADNLTSMAKGNAIEVTLSNGMLGYVAETYGQAKQAGLYTVKLYRTQDHTPCAYAFCDEFDL